jgi:hypothetical protein
MSKSKTITLEPKEVAILEEAIKDKAKDIERDINWQRHQGDMQGQEKSIEKVDTLEKIKRKLQ